MLASLNHTMRQYAVRPPTIGPRLHTPCIRTHLTWSSDARQTGLGGRIHRLLQCVTRTRTMGNPVISSDKVEGTAVYNPDGKKLGSIDDLVIDKRSGVVRYAALEFGGFLGIG